MTKPIGRLLFIEIVFEAVTGLLLLAIPLTLIAWVFGDRAPVDATLGRVAGAGLLALAGGCWLIRRRNGGRSALIAFQLYNIPVAIFLVVVGFATEYVGVLLWPAVVAHVALSALIYVALAPQPREKA